MPMCEDHESFCVLKSWGEAVKSKDKAKVLAHYAHGTGATLWPTLSNQLRKNEERIGDYFVSEATKSL